MALAKNPTQWQPPSGSGYIITVGNEFLETNLSDLLVTNIGDYLVTTPTYAIPKNKTLWGITGV